MSSKKRKRSGNVINIGDYQRRPMAFRINVGLVILIFLVVYMIICVVGYFRTRHIVSYEVVKGSLSVSNVYEGIILRQEESYPATGAGYLNFFAREGEHLAAGDLVYSLDSSGKIGEMLRSQSEDLLLSDDDLSQIREQTIQFQKEFTPEQFGTVYNFQSLVSSNVMKLSNYNMLDQLQMISGGDSANFVYAPKSGTVVFGADGLENLKAEDVTMELFSDRPVRQAPLSGDLVSAQDPAFKLIDSEKWSIVVPMDAQRAAELEEEKYVKVRFLKNQYESWGKVTTLFQAGGTFVKLDFTNSCITFAQDRYIDIEILLSQKEGLKVPNSAIVEKSLYLIPLAYKMDSKNSKDGGFMVETFDDDGNRKLVFRDTRIYHSNDEYYYVDDADFQAGERIFMPDNTEGEGYVISRMDTVSGVYNMNKGFADFTVVNILYQNDEYSIVKSNTAYGLSEYDFIVLDANSVKPDMFLYE